MEAILHLLLTSISTLFKRSCKGLSRLWLRDDDPLQNSKAAYEALARCHSELLKILPQSPDLNLIEYIFHIVSKKLAKDALERGIMCESYEQFCERVQRTITGISQQLMYRISIYTKTVDRVKRAH